MQQLRFLIVFLLYAVNRESIILRFGGRRVNAFSFVGGNRNHLENNPQNFHFSGDYSQQTSSQKKQRSTTNNFNKNKEQKNKRPSIFKWVNSLNEWESYFKQTVSSFRGEPDPYTVLELPKYSSMKEVKSSYRKLAKRLHPDKTGNDPVAREKFLKVQKAYNLLIEREKESAGFEDLGDFSSESNQFNTFSTESNYQRSNEFFHFEGNYQQPFYTDAVIINISPGVLLILILLSVTAPMVFFFYIGTRLYLLISSKFIDIFLRQRLQGNYTSVPTHFKDILPFQVLPQHLLLVFNYENLLLDKSKQNKKSNDQIRERLTPHIPEGVTIICMDMANKNSQVWREFAKKELIQEPVVLDEVHNPHGLLVIAVTDEGQKYIDLTPSKLGHQWKGIGNHLSKMLPIVYDEGKPHKNDKVMEKNENKDQVMNEEISEDTSNSLGKEEHICCRFEASKEGNEEGKQLTKKETSKCFIYSIWTEEGNRLRGLKRETFKSCAPTNSKENVDEINLSKQNLNSHIYSESKQEQQVSNVDGG